MTLCKCLNFCFCSEFSDHEEEPPPAEISNGVKDTSLSAGVNHCSDKSIYELSLLDQEVTKLLNQPKIEDPRPSTSFDLRNKIASSKINGLPDPPPLFNLPIFSGFNNQLKNFTAKEDDDPHVKYIKLMKGNCFADLRNKKCKVANCQFQHDVSLYYLFFFLR